MAMQKGRERIMRGILAACVETATLRNELAFLPIQCALTTKIGTAFLMAAIRCGAGHALSSPRSIIAICARFGDFGDMRGAFSIVEAGFTTLQHFGPVSLVLAAIIDEDQDPSDVDAYEAGDDDR